MFKNKVIVITGAASGIGKALALECASHRAQLALIDIQPEAMADLKSELDTLGVICSTHLADVGHAEAVKKAAHDIFGFHRQIDLLINNAGIYVASPFESADLCDFERVMQVNFMGTVYCCKYFLPYLRQSPEAGIANMCSGFGLAGFPNKSSYCSSKSAMIGFSKTLMTELSGSSVQVTLIFPPAVDTGLIRHGKAWDAGKKDKEIAFIQAKGIPAEKVARLVVNGLVRKQRVIKIGFVVHAIDWAARLMPAGIQYWLGRYQSAFEFV